MRFLTACLALALMVAPYALSAEDAPLTEADLLKFGFKPDAKAAGRMFDANYDTVGELAKRFGFKLSDLKINSKGNVGKISIRGINLIVVATTDGTQVADPLSHPETPCSVMASFAETAAPAIKRTSREATPEEDAKLRKMGFIKDPKYEDTYLLRSIKVGQLAKLMGFKLGDLVRPLGVQVSTDSRIIELGEMHILIDSNLRGQEAEFSLSKSGTMCTARAMFFKEVKNNK